MTQVEITALVEKYWKGQSSLDDEGKLWTLYRDNKISEHQELIQYFNFINGIKGSRLDESFDDVVLEKIQPQQKGTIYSIKNLMRIAAALVVLMMAFAGWKQNQAPVMTSDSTVIIDTYDDSAEAYHEVKKALFLISSKMNEGLTHTQVLSKFDEANHTISNGR